MNRSLSSVPRSFQEKGFEKNAKSVVPPAWKPLFQMIGQLSGNCSRMDGIRSYTGICKKKCKTDFTKKIPLKGKKCNKHQFSYLKFEKKDLGQNKLVYHEIDDAIL